MLNVLSLFSGIGAFEKALDNLGIEYKLLGYCEIDKYASKAYSLIHNVPESMNYTDVTKIDDLDFIDEDIDLITYGFPCQDISLAGKQKGFTDEEGKTTRSGLFFEALRIIEDYKPKYAIAENVKNLTSKKFSKEFSIVLDSLEKAGYRNYWKVLNAKDYGIPQNRERVFIVSIRKDLNQDFVFPEKIPLKLRLKDLLEDSVDKKYFLSQVTIESCIKHRERQEAKGNGFGFEPRERERAEIAHTITTRAGSRNTDNYIVENIPSSGLQNFNYEEDPMDTNKIMKVGVLSSSQDGVVVDERGLSPTHTAGHGNCPKVLTGRGITWQLKRIQRKDLRRLTREIVLTWKDRTLLLDEVA